MFRNDLGRCVHDGILDFPAMLCDRLGPQAWHGWSIQTVHSTRHLDSTTDTMSRKLERMNEPRPEGPPPTPRWVMALAVIALLVGLLVLIVLVSGIGGPHGPLRHIPGAS